MNMTPRQRTFLQKLSNLVADSHSAVHYSQVASEMGVSKFSAYDMLRVLEDKGLVAADYVLDQPNSGPGRSMVVFRPTPQGEREASHGDATDRERTGREAASDCSTCSGTRAS